MNVLIDRYIHQVREHLPEQFREDVARELESLLRDAVEDRARERGVSDELVVEVLREFGDPAVAAERYKASMESSPEEEWMPVVSRQARRIAVAVALGLAALWALMLIIAFAAQPLGWRAFLSPAQAGQWLFSYAVTVFANLGLLAVLYAVFGSRHSRAAATAAFDPRTLPPVPGPAAHERAIRVWALAAAVVSAGALLVMNVFPRWFGVPTSSSTDAGARFEVLPFSHVGLALPQGVLNAWWVAAAALAVALFLRGRWTRPLRLSVLVLELAGGGLFLYVASISNPESAPPQFAVVGRMAVAMLVLNGLALLACGAYGFWTAIRPHAPAAQATLA